MAYRILNEIFIFAIGISIASFVLISFVQVQEFVAENSAKSQLDSVSNYVASGLLKGRQNSIVKLEIPQKIAENNYRIVITEQECEINVTGNKISSCKKFFKITEDYNITGNITSAAKYLEIVQIGNETEIVRGD